MSKSVFAALPRFDSVGADASLRVSKDWRRPLDEAAPPSAPRAAPSAAAIKGEPEAPASLDLKKIEASLVTLNGKLDKIERDAHAQTLATVQAMASKLFPELSRDFLAEEIARHLPSLVPASAAVVVIKAEASLADALRALVERTPSLMNRCTITSVEGEGQGRVDVSWQSGGLTFDFGALLAACLSNLNSTQSATKE